MKRLLPTLLALPLAVTSFAAEKTFTVNNEKLAYRNIATVESESDFETFTGKTTAISGSINFDPQTRKGSGSLAIDVSGIDTGIPMRNDHMRGAMWLDAEKYPQITFTATSVKWLGKDDYNVTGNFTLRGVTRKITTKARVRFKAYGPEAKQAGFDGDVVQISTKFPIKLSDYKVVVPDMLKQKVANQVTISLSAYAIAR